MNHCILKVSAVLRNKVTDVLSSFIRLLLNTIGGCSGQHVPYKLHSILPWRTTLLVVACICVGVTNVQAQNNCREATIAYWNLDLCYPDNSFSDFTADIYVPTEFESVTASILSNNGGSHSCSLGQNGTGICSGSKDDCNWNDNDSDAFTFSVTVTPKPGTTTSLTYFSFYEKGPLMYEWLNGETGPNDPPTKYGWRILKNGVEIGQSTNNTVTQDWSLEQFDFNALGINTEVSTQTTFSFELLGYCRSGNTSAYDAWDIDEIKIYSCTDDPIPETTNLEITYLTICAGESITIASQINNATYDWNNNIKTKSQVVSPARTTTYKVQSNTGSFADGTFQAYYHHFNVRVEDCGTTSPPDPLCGVDQCYVPIYGDPMALFKFDNCVEGNSFANYSSATTSNNSCYNVYNTNIGSTYGQSGHPLSPNWGSNLYECEVGSSGVYSTENRIAFLQNVPGLTYEDVQDQYHYVEMTVSPNECGSISCVTFHLDIFEYGYWSPDKFYLRVKQNGNEVALVKDIEDVSGLCDIYQICFDEVIEFSETSTFSFEFYSYGDKYNRTSWPDAATQMHIDDFAIHGGCGTIIAAISPKVVGSVCNDNNPNTANDVIQANGCDCAGVICPTSLPISCEYRLQKQVDWTTGNCNPTICADCRLELSVSPDNYTSYQWSGPNGFNATGNAAGDVLVSNSLMPNQAGTYTVTVTDANGCTGTSAITIDTKECPCNLYGIISNQTYLDNSTTNTAQHTFTYDLSIAGSGANGWLLYDMVDGNLNQVIQTGSNGKTLNMGPFPVDQNGSLLILMDADNTACIQSFGVNMNSCVYTGACDCSK